jgi:phospholipid-binding lipoprotein MlaA
MNSFTLPILTLLFCLSGCALHEKSAVTKSIPIGETASASKPGSSSKPVAGAASVAGDDFDSAPAKKMDDPLQGLNRSIFRFNDGLYSFALRPVAHGYAIVVPRPIRTGISNVFENSDFPVRFVNCVLQGKLIRSAQETGKFLINSTAGVGGLIRVSDHVEGLIDVPAEDFGQTLGVWGIPAGPYILIPVLGPSDCRDLAGKAGDFAASPINWHALGLIRHAFITDAVNIAITSTRYVNALPKAVEAYDQMKGEAVDPYIAMRDGYLSYRAAQVKK